MSEAMSAEELERIALSADCMMAGPVQRDMSALLAHIASQQQEIERLRGALEKIQGGFWSGGTVDAIIARDWHPAVTESQRIARAALSPPPKGTPQERALEVK